MKKGPKIQEIMKIPSPQGDFLVVMWRTLVGILTGPFTLRRLSLAPRTKSPQTNHNIGKSESENVSEEIKSNKIIKQNMNGSKKVPFSRFWTCLEERVILILWICSWDSSKPGFVGLGAAYAIVVCSEYTNWEWRWN